MRVLVTGGTGYLGAAIVRALDARGVEPLVFSRRATASRLPGTLIDGDVRDREAVRRGIEASDAVIHAAALVSVWRPRAQEFDEINIAEIQTCLFHHLRNCSYGSYAHYPGRNAC